MTHGSGQLSAYCCGIVHINLGSFVLMCLHLYLLWTSSANLWPVIWFCKSLQQFLTVLARNFSERLLKTEVDCASCIKVYPEDWVHLVRTCGIMESFLCAARCPDELFPERSIFGLSLLLIQPLFFAFIWAMQLLPVYQGEGKTLLLTILCSLLLFLLWIRNILLNVWGKKVMWKTELSDRERVI